MLPRAKKDLVCVDILTVLNWPGVRSWARLSKNGWRDGKRLLSFLRWVGNVLYLTYSTTSRYYRGYLGIHLKVFGYFRSIENFWIQRCLNSIGIAQPSYPHMNRWYRRGDISEVSCYITPAGPHYTPAMCYMVSRIGGSFKDSCVEFLLMRGHILLQEVTPLLRITESSTDSR